MSLKYQIYKKYCKNINYKKYSYNISSKLKIEISIEINNNFVYIIN